MIPKIDRARRIRYKGDEIYIMRYNDAQRIFPNALFIEDYPDDSIVAIIGADENKHGVCASSDWLIDNEILIMASYDNKQHISDTQETWKPYTFHLFMLLWLR